MQFNTRDLRSANPPKRSDAQTSMGNNQVKLSHKIAKESFLNDLKRHTQGVEFKMRHSDMNPADEEEDVTEIGPPVGAESHPSMHKGKHVSRNTGNAETQDVGSSKPRHQETRPSKLASEAEPQNLQPLPKSLIMNCLSSISKSLAIEESGGEEMKRLGQAIASNQIIKPVRLGASLEPREDDGHPHKQQQPILHSNAVQHQSHTDNNTGTGLKSGGFGQKYGHSKMVTEIESDERELRPVAPRLPKDRLFASGDGGEEFSLPSRIGSIPHKKESMTKILKKKHPFESEEEAEERRASEARSTQIRGKTHTQLKAHLDKLISLQEIDRRSKSPSATAARPANASQKAFPVAMKTASNAKAAGTIRVEDCEDDETSEKFNYGREIQKNRSTSLKRLDIINTYLPEKRSKPIDSRDTRRSPSQTMNVVNDKKSHQGGRLGAIDSREGLLKPMHQSMTAICSSKYSKFFQSPPAHLQPQVAPLDLAGRGRLALSEYTGGQASQRLYHSDHPERPPKIGDSRALASKRSSPLSHITCGEDDTAVPQKSTDPTFNSQSTAKPPKNKNGGKKPKDKDAVSNGSVAGKHKTSNSQHPECE